jgi:hypothetical protein
MQKTSGMLHQPSWQHIRGLECISPMKLQAERLQSTSEYGNDQARDDLPLGREFRLAGCDSLCDFHV